jgi:hypothetical protein
MSGGTNKEPMGYTDAWNHIPVRAKETNGRFFVLPYRNVSLRSCFVGPEPGFVQSSCLIRYETEIESCVVFGRPTPPGRTST